MKLRITKEHILNGIRRDIHQCPITLAVIDLGYFPATVEDDKIFSNGTVWNLPESARDFTEAFDEGLPVEPFEFVAEKEADYCSDHMIARDQSGMCSICTFEKRIY